MAESMKVADLIKQLSASDADTAREALGQIQSMIAAGQVKEAQSILRAAGKYEGPIDGDAGRGTLGAIKALSKDIETRGQRSLERQRLENETPALDAAREYGPPALGLPAGYLAAQAIDNKFTRDAEAKAGEAAKLAKRRDIDPRVADKVARKRGMYTRGFGSELGKRMILPGLFLGGAEFTEQQAEANPGMADFLQPLAVGERYAALGAATQGVKGALSRKQPSSAVDEATLRSRAAEAKRAQPGILSRVRGAQPSAQGSLPPPEPTPPPTQPTPRTPKGALEKALRNISGAKAIPPIAAGVLAYDAATGPSEAAQGEVEAGTGQVAGDDPNRQLRGVGAGVGAAGLTAGAMRLMDSPVGRIIGRAAGPAMAGMTAYDVARSSEPYMPESAEGDPAASAQYALPATVMGISDMREAGRDAFESALSEFMELMSEIKMGSADQIPRRPGPQL